MKKIKVLLPSIIFIICIAVSISVFNFLIVFLMKSYHIPKNIYSSGDVLSILSLNVGILQTLVAVITLGIALTAFFNFFNMKKEFKRLKVNANKKMKYFEKKISHSRKANIKKITEETKSIEKNKNAEEIKDDIQ